MRLRVQQWGHSLALRIPKSFAEETTIESGSEVDVTLEEGRLVVTPVSDAAYRLDDLIAQITPENIHGEIDMGPRIGNEVW